MAEIIRIVILLIIALICILRRKDAIGGWLLFYFISMVLSMLIWLAVTIPALPLLDPSAWNDKGRYALFLFTAISNDVLIMAQFIVSMMIISKRFRDWRYVNYLRIILLSQIILSLIILPVDLSISPESVLLDVISTIAPAIWLSYFTFSKRVRSVYRDKDWVQRPA